MNNGELLEANDLEMVSGGAFIVKDKGYNLRQIAWLYVDEAIARNSRFPAEEARIKANWTEIQQELIEAGHENVTVDEFTAQVKNSYLEHVLRYWPPF